MFQADKTSQTRDAISRPMKIVFLGAGSFFVKTFLVDLLATPGADRGEFALVDVAPQRLDLACQLANLVIRKAGKGGWKVTASCQRENLLAGADYIINCIEVSGLDAVRLDYEIPLRYGVDQCIGDTCGPGGLMKAIRTVPAWLEILADVRRLCPDAWVLNYTNPMSIMCLAAARAGAKNVIGLCHSVQDTSRRLAEYATVAPQSLSFRCGGINHLAWFTELKSDGQDLYPILAAKLAAYPELYEQDPVRFDMMRHFGYFITESSGHLSEYLPYYRKRRELIDKYCRDGYRGQSGFYADRWPTWRQQSDEHRMNLIDGKCQLNMNRSHEYASYIIEAMETNRPFVAHANVPNAGLIDNLQADGIVEVACRIDAAGVHPIPFGPLPPQCAAICDWNMRMYDLAACACVEKSRAAAIHALMLDPLTASVCCPDEIRRMADELFQSQKNLLPEWI